MARTAATRKAASAKAPAKRASTPAAPPKRDLLLPEGTRLVHIGPYKTGTTALQAAFHLARGRAEAQGVHYAGYGRQPMTAILAAINLPSPWDPDRKPPNIRYWHQLLGEIRGSRSPRVVLSSEFLSDADPSAIRRVVDDIGVDRIRIVVTLRPLAKIIPSQWQQYIQNRHTEPFDDWLDALLNQPRGAVTPTFWKRHRHDELIARWSEVVGPENVTAIVLDDNDRGLVFRAFEDLVGLSRGTLVPDPDLSNRSLTLAEIEVVRAFNVAYQEAKLPRVLYQRVMRTGAAQLMERRIPQADEGRVDLPRWAVEPVRKVATSMVDAIGRSGVQIVGDLDALTAVSTDRADGPMEVHVSPTAAASVAMGILIASGLARGTLPSADPEDDPLAEARPRPPRPIPEPPELFRVSTVHLGLILVRRLRAASRDRISRLFRRT